MCLNLDTGNTACRTLPRTDTYIIIHIKRSPGNYFSDKPAATLVVQSATHRFRIPSENMEQPRSSITVCIPSADLSRRRTPKSPVITAIIRSSHHWLIPNSLASTASWILNNPSTSTSIPIAVKNRFTTPAVCVQKIIPRMIRRMPKARSY